MWYNDISIVTFIYWSAAFLFVAPPSEVAAAGFTVQNLFGRRIGDEKLNFIRHHLNRGSLTLCIHSLLPLGESKIIVIGLS